MEDEEVQQRVRQAREATSQGRYLDATVILSDGLEELPRSWEIRLELAINYVYQGYLGRAISTLDDFIHGVIPYPENPGDRDLIAFLYTSLNARRTFYFPPIWEPSCKRIWDVHLRNLTPGKDTYSETDVRLEVLWHEAINFARERNGPCAGFDLLTPATKNRLHGLCQQLSTERREAEALSVAWLLKKLWPHHPFDSSDLALWNGFSNEGLATLLLLDGAFDDAESLYLASTHKHGHIDVETCRLQRILYTATPSHINVVASRAHDLVSQYENVDYARGSLFVLRVVVGWLPYHPALTEKLDLWEDLTGEIPMRKLRHFASLLTLAACRANLLPYFADRLMETPSAVPIQTTVQGAVSHSHAGPSLSQAHDPVSGGLSSLIPEFARTYVSKASGFFNSGPSWEDSDRPLTEWEWLKLSAKAQAETIRSVRQPSAKLFSDMETLKTRMPPSLLQQQPGLVRGLDLEITRLTLLKSLHSHGSPSQIIQQAETAKRGLSPINSRSVEEWKVYMQAQHNIIQSHRRTRNIERSLEVHQDTLNEMKFAPNTLALRIPIKAFEKMGAILGTELEMKKTFDAARQENQDSSGRPVNSHSRLARGKLRRNPDEILSSLQDFENRVQAAQKEFAKINPAEHPDNPKVLEAHEQATRIMEQANQIVSTFKDTINKPIGKTGIGFPPVVKQLPTALRGPVNMVSALSKIPRPAWKMLGSVVGADVGLMLDFMNAICRCIGPVSSKAEIEALRTCCRRFKELQRADPEQAGRCVDVAILGYHMLGICLLSHEDTPLYRYGRPTLELLDESRETLQASADLVQWSFDRELPAGRLWGSNLHASLLWWISKAYIQAGHENMDLKLLQEGVKCLEDAAAMATGARRQQDATFSDAFRILEDKQRFGGNSDITRVYHEGMGAILDSTDYANDPLQKAEVLAACWKWVQRHKAASLSDTLSLNQRVLPSNFKTLENYPNQAELIREEVAILDRLAQDESLDLNVYITLHRDLNAVRMRMEDYPLLQEIIRDRDCDGMDLDNLVSMVLRSGCFNDEIAFIDWVIEPETDEIMITCATCVMGHGKVNITQTTGLTASQVSEWVDQNLNHRVVSNADIAYHRLQDLEPLVRPLKTMTRPGAVLVLCPTMGLRHVPLHAMMIDDEQILLERNPVVYTPSFTVLHHLARIQEDRSGILERTDKQNAVISVYASESPNSPEPKRVTDSLSSLSSRLGTSLQSGAHVSVPFFVSYTHDCDIIHFHGHSVSTSGAETQALVLEPDREDFDTGTRSDVPNSDNNDHHLTARTVLQAISFNRTPLIVNMACSSGKNQFKPGDELFGLTPAFLLAGAATVVGTMWPIRSADGRLFTKHFYGELDKGKDGQGSQSGKRQTVNVARALQQAALRIRDDEATEAPYHWAGFVMSGLWKLKL